MELAIRNKILDLNKPLIMGIMNVTPDSFFDGGKYTSENGIIAQTEKMLEEGATIIDIGAVSTRPGAKLLSDEEEWQRVKPIIKLLVIRFPGTVFSIDTFRSKIAYWAVQEGVQMVNDISGGILDPHMPEVIARIKVPYVMMHMQGNPQTMQDNPQYENVVADVNQFFEKQLLTFKLAGATENIILDPGFGFGKTLAHNYQLLGNIKAFRDMGRPILVGLSRKSMINKVLNTNPEEALNGTTILNTIALLNGADILRVHDVKEARQAIELVESYRRNLKTDHHYR